MVVLVVLAKAPVAGRVKTRLCPPANEWQAARIAAAALLDTLDAVRATPGAQPVLALSGDLDKAERAVEIKAALCGIPVVAQHGATLGQRIAAAHRDAEVLGPGRAVVQIGMDTPQVTADLLRRCHRRLSIPGTDAVLGPTEDGGWWVLGLRDPLEAGCIAGVATSRADTGVCTARALQERGLRVAQLPQLTDVDTPMDAFRVARQAPHTRFAAAVRELL